MSVGVDTPVSTRILAVAVIAVADSEIYAKV